MTIFDSYASAPVVERIIDVLIARIKEANIADVDPFRTDREGLNSKVTHGALGIHQDVVRRNSDIDREGNPPAIGYELLLNLHLFVRNQNAIENSPSKSSNVILAHIIQAITNPITNPHMWYSMDGLACDVRFGDVQSFYLESGAHAGQTLPVMIDFRVSENNHFEVR